MTPLTQALNAALLHFIWQGMVIGFVLWIALFLLRRRSANVRYLLGCGALLLLALAPVVTAALMYEPRSFTLLSWEAAFGTGAQNGETSATTPPGDWFVFQRLEEWILPVWGLGVALLALRLMWCWGHTSALRRTGTDAGETFIAMVAKTAETLGVTRKVRVLMSSLAEVPSVIGWVRPVLLLPVAVATGLTAEQLEALIAHELAHIRRHDYLVNLGQTVVETVLFYHPVVWWASSRIRYERELCCDDLAVATLGDATRYARALARLEEVRILRPSLAMGAAHGPLFHRIERLLGGDGFQQRPSRVACAVGLIIGVGVLALNMTWAQERPNVFRNNGTPVEDLFAPLPPTPPVVPEIPLVPEPAMPPLPPLVPTAYSAAYAAPQQLSEGDIPWVLFRGDRAITNGSAADEAEARTARALAGNGDVLWFKMQGRAYLTQDRAVLDRVLEGRFMGVQVEGTLDFFRQEQKGLADQQRYEKFRAMGAFAEARKQRELQAAEANEFRKLEELRRLEHAVNKVSEPATGELKVIREEVERLRQALAEMASKLQRSEELKSRLEIQRDMELKLRQAEAARQSVPEIPDLLREVVSSGKAQPVK